MGAKRGDMGEGIFAGFLGRLRSRSGAARRSLFVHEDDWGQIEVLPAACAGWCTHEMGRIRAFSAAHIAPDGGGWTEIYVREPPPIGLADLALPLAAVTSGLEQHLPAFDEVTSGTFSRARRVSRVKAFGLGQGAAIVVTPDDDGTRLATVHLLLDGAPQVRGEIVRAAAALIAEEPLVLVDWPRARLFALSDTYAVERYVRS